MSGEHGRVPLDLGGLGGSSALFRLSRGRRRDPAVQSWLAQPAGELRELARECFGKLRDCGDDVLEQMHDGCPVACVEDAPFAYVNAFRRHVNLGFFNGASLPDPAGLLEGSGKRMRHVKLGPGSRVDGAALEALIHAAYRDIRQRLQDDGGAT